MMFLLNICISAIYVVYAYSFSFHVARSPPDARAINLINADSSITFGIQNRFALPFENKSKFFTIKQSASIQKNQGVYVTCCISFNSC